jgi:hypothetical protein
MNRIPKVVDELMWRVAESADPEAAREFGDRYPGFVGELERRIAMVDSLRGSRPRTSTPRFAYPSAPVSQGWPRSAWAVSGALAAALAFAAFLSVRPPERPVQPPEAPTATTAGRAQPSPTRGSSMEGVVPDAAAGGQPQPYQPAPPARTAPASPFETLVSLDASSIRLSQAIQAIAQQASLVIEVAPGFQDETIEARYAGVTAKQALDDLGQNFGFTVIVQQGRNALLIPALDPNRPPASLPDGSYSLPSTNVGDGNGSA